MVAISAWGCRQAILQDRGDFFQENEFCWIIRPAGMIQQILIGSIAPGGYVWENLCFSLCQGSTDVKGPLSLGLRYNLGLTEL